MQSGEQTVHIMQQLLWEYLFPSRSKLAMSTACTSSNDQKPVQKMFHLNKGQSSPPSSPLIQGKIWWLREAKGGLRSPELLFVFWYQVCECSGSGRGNHSSPISGSISSFAHLSHNERGGWIHQDSPLQGNLWQLCCWLNFPFSGELEWKKYSFIENELQTLKSLPSFNVLQVHQIAN